MIIINPNFKRNKKVYFLKCLVALCAMTFILISLKTISSNVILGAIGASSLASSVFIAFSLPDCASAHPRRMIGSYLISIIVGVIFYYIGTYFILIHDYLSFSLIYEIMGAFAVTTTMLMMILLSLEHPPAAGLALGLVLEPWEFRTLTIIIGAIIATAIIKSLVKPWLLPDSPHDG